MNLTSPGPTTLKQKPPTTSTPLAIKSKTDPSLAAKGLPRHLGIIMDGNGRWAVARNKARYFGHRQGLEAVKRIVKAARRLGIPYLSLYTFSTENWKRSREEVDFLMNLILRHLREDFDFYRENQIRVVHSGDLEDLPPAVKKEIQAVAHDTKDFEGITVNMAINYGGRDEILRAVKTIVKENLSFDVKQDPQAVLQRLNDLGEADFHRYLDSPEIPDADLIIRTGGERRLSNFLLWKSAYAELVFSDRLWPDWDEADLLASLVEFRNRDRRFGLV